MRSEFICANHRQWLRERPKEARHWWAKSFDSGKYFQEVQQWQESVCPLGCAFDAATIFIEQSQIVEAEDIDLFSRTAQCLVYSLLKIGQLKFAQQIVFGVQSMTRNMEGQVFNRQKMLDMQRKLHLFLAAHPAVRVEPNRCPAEKAKNSLFSREVVSIH